MDQNRVVYLHSSGVEEVKSVYHDICVMNTKDQGMTMFLDGQLVVSEKDSHHREVIEEMLKEEIENELQVVVLRGGDMQMASVLLQEGRVGRVTVVEEDGEVTRLVKTHFSHGANCYDHISENRLVIDNTNINTFLQQQLDTSYDYVIVDRKDAQLDVDIL